MCGRYALDYDSESLPAAFGQWGINTSISSNTVNNTEVSRNNDDSSLNSEPSSTDTPTHYDESYNIAPTRQAPVFNPNKDEIRYMKWGLLPHWSKKPGTFTGYSTFNARLDKLLASKMWSGCLSYKRCAIPMSGYYEWLSGQDNKKIPYYLRRKDNKIMLLAGLYDYNETENLFTFTIITGPAPKNLEWLHDRMPSVLEVNSAAWKSWMDPTKTKWDQSDLDKVLTPWYDEEQYRVYQVNKDVGKVSNNGAYLTKPILKMDSERIKKDEEGEVSLLEGDSTLVGETSQNNKEIPSKSRANKKKRSIIDMMRQGSVKRRETAFVKKENL